MRIRVAIAAVALTGLAAPVCAAAHKISWGKPHVSLTDYRADAITCARKAVAIDVSDTEAAKILVQASRRIDNAFTPADVAADVAAARPERQFEEVSDLQHKALANCLTARGYQRFELTKQQRKRLGKLDPGSDARRAYLYSLGSDPKVLDAQVVADSR